MDTSSESVNIVAIIFSSIIFFLIARSQPHFKFGLHSASWNDVVSSGIVEVASTAKPEKAATPNDAATTRARKDEQFRQFMWLLYPRLVARIR